MQKIFLLTVSLLVILYAPFAHAPGEPIGITQGTPDATTTDQRSVTLAGCSFTAVECSIQCSGSADSSCVLGCIGRRYEERDRYYSCLEQQSPQLVEFVLSTVEQHGCLSPLDTKPCYDACYAGKDPLQFSSCLGECSKRGDMDINNYEFCIDLKIIEVSEFAWLESQAANMPTPAVRAKDPLSLEIREIGKIGNMKGVVEIEGTDGIWRQVQPGVAMLLNDRIRTGPNGRAQILLKDETAFTIGGNTEMVVDTFVYDPAAPGAYGMLLEFLRGTFRFVTGKIAEAQPQKVKVKVPSGDLGSRGTDFIVSYDPAAKLTTIHTFEGIATYTSNATGQTYEVSAGQTAVFSDAGGVSNVPLTKAAWDSLVKEITPREPIPTALMIIIGTGSFGVALLVFEFIRSAMKRRRKGK